MNVYVLDVVTRCRRDANVWTAPSPTVEPAACRWFYRIVPDGTVVGPVPQSLAFTAGVYTPVVVRGRAFVMVLGRWYIAYYPPGDRKLSDYLQYHLIPG